MKILLLMVVLRTVLSGPTTVPGGSIFPSSNLPGFYGNNVTLRTAFLPTGARKSWIDFEIILPPGFLQKYFIYVHNVSMPETSQIHLQIWRPEDITNYGYSLQWEKLVTVDLNTATGILYTFVLSPAEQFRVQQGDRIGWTNEGSFCPISFEFIEEHKTYFRNVENETNPVVGSTYTFDNIHLPYIFSVAVEVHVNPISSTPITFTDQTPDLATVSSTPITITDQTSDLDFKIPFAVTLILLLVLLVVVIVLLRKWLALYYMNKDQKSLQKAETVESPSNQTPIHLYEASQGDMQEENRSPNYEDLDVTTIEMYENPQNHSYEGSIDYGNIDILSG